MTSATGLDVSRWQGDFDWHAHPDHPLIRSYEPGEDWWWCYDDEVAFEVDGAGPSPSHP